MVSKRISTRVHQPGIRIINALFVQTIKQRPGLAHVTQHNIYTLVLVFCPVGGILIVVFFCALLSLHFEVTLARRLADNILADRCLSGFIVALIGEDGRAAHPTAVGIAEEVFHICLDVGREEVALHRADTFGWLDGNEVDTEDAAAGFR